MTTKIADGYRFDEPTIALGTLLADGQPVPSAQISMPIRMLNRHGMVCGATGTGKTKTLQLLAEQISAAGVPVFAADIKGDLSGLASAGTASDKLSARTVSIGQDWDGEAAPVEFLSLGDTGSCAPVRATVAGFGPVLLAKVLGLNAVQESSLAIVMHWAETRGRRLITIGDLRRLLIELDSPDGRAELRAIGGVSSATLGVILRELAMLDIVGAGQLFGEPAFDVADLLRTDELGRGVISLLELADVQESPELFSTFLMWLLRELFRVLPEVGDADKPKLVFFFDEAHLLFRGASDAFLDTVANTVRLIRSKGVGVFFVTQTPKDVPEEVLAQLGSRVQHQLRAYTPNDAKALRQTAATYPTSDYDLAQLLQHLGIGDAVVTVMGPDGAPTPVAWTRMRAPRSLMGPADAETISEIVDSSPLSMRYAAQIEPEPVLMCDVETDEPVETESVTPPAVCYEPHRSWLDAVGDWLASPRGRSFVRALIRGFLKTLR